jgi:hypothetical protein
MHDNTFSVRDELGQTTTYMLSNTTTITKLVRGALSDLALGETVLIHRNGTGTAILIEILNS